MTEFTTNKKNKLKKNVTNKKKKLTTKQPESISSNGNSKALHFNDYYKDK